MKKILEKLNIDETFTKSKKKIKSYTHIKDNIPLKADYNMMADLLFLPQTKEGFKYLLVVVDLATDEFDMEPLKNKESVTTLDALKEIFKRQYVHLPKATLATDQGTEFKGVFHKYLYDESVFHKQGLTARHQQVANIESLNRQLGRIFNGYMNTKEQETAKVYKEWTDIIDVVREDLNKYRKKQEKDIFTHVYPAINANIKAKYKIGDIVHRILEEPKNALGKKQSTSNFRMGDYRYDTIPRKITKIFYYSGQNPIRYMLDTLDNVTYAENELLPSKQQEEKFEVKKILGRRTINKEVQYKIWWKNDLKKDAQWYKEKDLITDIPKLIAEFNKKKK